MNKDTKLLKRRDFLKSSAICLGSASFGLCAGAYKFQIGQALVANTPKITISQERLLLPTPSCGGGGTPWVSEGPFYAPATPLKRDLRPTLKGGHPLRLAGRVLSTSCQPVAGAILDFWQTDPDGNYDHFGYEFRGHQFSDEYGRYELLTWLPACYVFMGIWRRRHIHVKVASLDHKQLTSQVFFPFDEDTEVEDFSFDKRLVTKVIDENTPFIEARFDFVIETA